MYLYEKKDNTIYFYELKADKNKIKEYKIDKTTDSCEFFVAEADSGSPNKILENNSVINIKDLNIKNSPVSTFNSITGYNNRFHSFKKDIIDENILKNYYLDVYINNPMVIVYKENFIPNISNNSLFDNCDFKGVATEGIIDNKIFTPKYVSQKQIVHYLLITGIYEKQYLSSHVAMRNIISLPKQLYLLQMMEQGKINVVGDEDLSELLPLFDFNPVPINMLLINDLDKIFKYELIKNQMNIINKKLESSEKILKKIRKK